MQTVRWIFFGPIGLRSGWRIVLWMIGSTVMSALLGVLVALAFGLKIQELSHPPMDVQLVLDVITCFPLVLLTWLFVRFLDHATLQSAGLGGPLLRHGLGELALGTALGAAVLTAAFAFDAAWGGASVELAHPEPVRFLLTLGALFVAAAGEELGFRGVPFQGLARGIGRPGATAIFSAVFGLFHMFNPDFTLFSFANIVVAGVFLSVCLFARGNLWFPIGVHFGWNAMQGMVLGVPISGQTGFPTLLTASVTGPAWRSGGGFGVEGSAGSLLMILLATIGLLLLRPKSAAVSNSAAGASGPGQA